MRNSFKNAKTVQNKRKLKNFQKNYEKISKKNPEKCSKKILGKFLKKFAIFRKNPKRKMNLELAPKLSFWAFYKMTDPEFASKLSFGCLTK